MYLKYKGMFHDCPLSLSASILKNLLPINLELDEDYIGPNGIAALCQDLGVEPEDVTIPSPFLTFFSHFLFYLLIV
jgi:hypothetical protein